ncbi:MAG: hypothetical protein ACREK4_11640 [Candidatus Rokuibacteriota bacterium]
MNIKSSPVARGARTARMFALLLGWNRDRPADCFGEAQVDLRFDVSADATQQFRLQLGKLMADSADLSGRSPVEEAQTYIRHNRPSSEDVGEPRHFQSGCPTVSCQQNQSFMPASFAPGRDSLTKPVGQQGEAGNSAEA